MPTVSQVPYRTAARPGWSGSHARLPPRAGACQNVPKRTAGCVCTRTLWHAAAGSGAPRRARRLRSDRPGSRRPRSSFGAQRLLGLPRELHGRFRRATGRNRQFVLRRRGRGAGRPHHPHARSALRQGSAWWLRFENTPASVIYASAQRMSRRLIRRANSFATTAETLGSSRTTPLYSLSRYALTAHHFSAVTPELRLCRRRQRGQSGEAAARHVRPGFPAEYRRRRGRRD